MSPPKTESASLDAETEITLGLLDAVEKNNALTQRSIAKDLGIALGLANAYLKRCIKKGLIKVTQAPANRYAYYLTPKGFVEKSRLTSRYLSISFNFFRRARGECVELLEVCSARGWNRIALGGVSDLAEIAILCAREYPVELAGIVDARTDEAHFALKRRRPVFSHDNDFLSFHRLRERTFRSTRKQDASQLIPMFNNIGSFHRSDFCRQTGARCAVVPATSSNARRLWRRKALGLRWGKSARRVRCDARPMRPHRASHHACPDEPICRHETAQYY